MSELALLYAIFAALVFVQAGIWAIAARDREERRNMVLLAVASFVWPVLLVAGVGVAVVAAVRVKAVRS